MTERRSGQDRREEPRGPERRVGGRPREFDGPPVSVRLPATLHDDLSREAIRRDADVIRERLARPREWRRAEDSNL
jgi:hypothetical protein